MRISRDHKGISTAAEWVNSLRTEGSLEIGSFRLDTFLQSCVVDWWPTADNVDFPPVGAMETTTCQPFVTAGISEIASCICGGQVCRRNFIDSYSSSSAQTIKQRVEFRSVPACGWPAIKLLVFLAVNLISLVSTVCLEVVVLLGDVKDCGPRNNDFSDVEVGHILDMRTDLLTKEQFTRTFLFCFLTDGYRFQFFLDVFEEVSRAAESHMNNLLCMAENMAGRYMRHSSFFHSMCFDRY